MNEYFNLQSRHVLTIMLPISFIVAKILFFLKAYIKNSNYIIKTFNYITIFFAVVSSIAFYLCNWGEYFAFIWFLSLFISIIQYNFMDRKTKYSYCENPNILEIMLNIASILIGIFILLIPHTQIFFMIGGGDTKVDFVSKILLSIYGILMILLDNHIVLFFNKFIYKTNRSKS
ncbi:hypothetical protein CHF27_013555 [Romboutsia maritimum]|uniref:Uncharacterized protein n=1 Tax=Romboutsia maritimum TaxID=2020948 RepID=A0A371IPL0_9FIRM|nr:hypothetical protein [Romboutsia maritimum]RDY22416.1 hypothetical protein CHF27_013555 [Romboutsia maritimum]